MQVDEARRHRQPRTVDYATMLLRLLGLLTYANNKARVANNRTVLYCLSAGSESRICKQQPFHDIHLPFFKGPNRHLYLTIFWERPLDIRPRLCSVMDYVLIQKPFALRKKCLRQPH